MPNQIILNGVELNHNMVWVERSQTQNVVQSTYRTIGGGLVVFHNELVKGERITLNATQDAGWLTKAVVDQVIAMANVAGGTYTLTIHDQSFDVMFRHEEPPAASFTPLINRINPDSADYYTGSIKLITV